MAVYTDITDAELDAFLADFDLGKPLTFKGIAEGVEFLTPPGMVASPRVARIAIVDPARHQRAAMSSAHRRLSVR